METDVKSKPISKLYLLTPMENGLISKVIGKWLVYKNNKMFYQ